MSDVVQYGSTIAQDVDVLVTQIWNRAPKRKRQGDLIKVDIANAVTSINTEDTIEGSSTLKITLVDTHWRLLMSGFFDPNSDGKLDPIEVNYPNGSRFWWRLANADVSSEGNTITLTFIERAMALLMTKKGVKKMSRGSVTRAQFLKSLVEEVKSVRLEFKCKELTKRQKIDSTGTSGDGPTGRGSVLWVGDSLGVGTGQYISDEVGKGVVQNESKQSRSSSAGLDVLKDKLKDKHKVVVFDLGTNDDHNNPSAYRDNLDAAHALIGKNEAGSAVSRLMVVATLNRGDNNSAFDMSAMNDTIDNFANQSNVTVVDWGAEDTYLAADKTHATAKGYEWRAKLFADAISSGTSAVLLGPEAQSIPVDTGGAPTTGGRRTPVRTAATNRDNKEPGIAAGSDVTIKGIKVTDDQIEQINLALGAADDENAGPKARKALVVAGIGESSFIIQMNQEGSGYGGVFQGDVSAKTHEWANDWHDTASMAKSFLRGGRGFQAGGAIKLAKDNPGISPGDIATRVEASGKAPSFYDTYGDEADKILDEFGAGTGSGGTTTTTTTTATTSYRKQYNFTREKGENSWEAMTRLADEVKWPLFADGDRIYFDSDLTLIAQKPVKRINRSDKEVLSWGYTLALRDFATELSITLICDPDEFRAGEVFKLDGFGMASKGKYLGKWLITNINRDRSDITSSFTLRQPITPTLEPAPEMGEHTITSTGVTTTGTTGTGGQVDGAVKGSPIPGQQPHASTHDTDGLPGYPAYDYMAAAGTPVVAPVDGKIWKLSGKDPKSGGAPGGALGYSIYLSGGGDDYFMTHLDKVLVKVDDQVKQGDQIAEVANGPASWSSPHCHMGVNRGGGH